METGQVCEIPHCGTSTGLRLFFEVIGIQNYFDDRAGKNVSRPIYSEPVTLCFPHFVKRLNILKRKENERRYIANKQRREEVKV
jgi:hypothetical protein